MAWTDLKAAIAAIVKTNGNQEITGNNLQQTLNSVVDNLGEDPSFVGIAYPNTVPQVPDGNKYYLAFVRGIYSNFSGITLNGNKIHTLSYNHSTSEWEEEQIKNIPDFFDLDSEINLRVRNKMSAFVKSISINDPLNKYSKFYLQDIYADYTSNPDLYQIRLFAWDGDSYVRIADYSETNASKDLSKYDYIEFNQYNLSGVRVRAIVDWNEIINQVYNVADRGIDENTFKLTDSIIKGDVNKIKEPRDYKKTIFAEDSQIDNDAKKVIDASISYIKVYDSLGLFSKFYLQDIYADYSSNPDLYQIRLFAWDGESWVRVADYSETNTEKTFKESDRIILNEYNSSGVSAEIIIDWGKIKGLRATEANGNAGTEVFKIPPYRVVTTYMNDFYNKVSLTLFKNESTIDTANKRKIYSLIKNISLNVPYGLSHVYLNDIYSNDSAYPDLYQIRVFGSYDNGSTFVRVAEYSITETKDVSEDEKIVLSEYNSSGVTGDAIVNWNALSGGHLNESDTGVTDETFIISEIAINRLIIYGNKLFARSGYVDNLGVFNSYAGWISTGYIPVSIIDGCSAHLEGGVTAGSIAYYDEDKVFISADVIGNISGVITLYDGYIPSDAVYVTFTTRNSADVENHGFWYRDVTEVDAVTQQDNFIHFSFDDTVDLFKDLTDNELTYNSIFDNDTLAWCRYMYMRFGARFSLFIFMKTEDLTWSMLDCTTAFANEFAEHYKWLKCGLHLGTLMMDTEISNYASATTGQAASDYAEFITTMKAVMGSNKMFDRMPRLHNFAATEEAAQEMRDADIGVIGYLGADDTRDSYYLTTAQSTLLFTRERFQDVNNQLHFSPTDIRVERDDSSAIFTAIESGITWNKKSKELVIFTHEYALTTAIKAEMELCALKGQELGYKFGYHQEVITQ